MMGGVNVVLLVLLVWTFTAVCEDTTANIMHSSKKPLLTDITPNCEDVTAHVGDQINLTCTVSHLKEGCVMMYKFDKTAAYNEEICKEESISDPCKQESRFSCPYTANKTAKFKFFLQTTCGVKETYFSVSTTGAVKDDTAGGSNTLKDKPDNTIKCEDVTAPVGDKINLNCTVYNLNKNCCITMYKFIDTAEYKNIQNICKEESKSDSCKQERRFSCPYTAKKAITTKFKFFLQTKNGIKTTEFSVITTDAVKDDTDGSNTLRYKEVLAVIIPVIMCLIVIIMWFILKKKLNFSTCGFHRNYDTDVSERNISLYSDREAVEQEHHINM